MLSFPFSTGFQDTVEAFGTGFDYGGDDDSFGGDDDDDGPGFMLADSRDDDFVINELDGVRKVEKIKVGYATVAKKVDVKRLKKDLWNELESSFAPSRPPPVQQDEDQDDSLDEDDESAKPPGTPVNSEPPKSLSFKETVNDMEANQPQGDVTLPFYFICLLHLANEKGLRLESTGLEDFIITSDNSDTPFEAATDQSSTKSVVQPKRRKKEVAKYVIESDSDSEGEETESDSD